MKRLNSLNVVALLVLAGCAASNTMQSYINEPISKIIEEYGAPTSVYETGRPNERAFVWVISSKHAQTRVSPASPGLYGLTWEAPKLTTGDAVTITCKYTIYAVHSNQELAGAEGWRVVGFEKPPINCQ